MRIIMFLLALLCLSAFLRCDQPTTVKVKPKVLPKNLNEAIEYFNKRWTVADKNNFKNQQEKSAVTQLHFTVGLWIRNSWIHGERDSSLVAYFNQLGVHSADDVSSIILTFLHRKLN